MKAWMQSCLLATLIGSLVGWLLWHYDLPAHLWPEHQFFCGLLLTALVTIVSQQVWSPEYFKRRSS
jgi:magnesium-transporting ATPase (P-type)